MVTITRVRGQLVVCLLHVSSAFLGGLRSCGAFCQVRGSAGASPSRSPRRVLVWQVFVALALAACGLPAAAQERPADEQQRPGAAARSAHLIRVPLPIRGTADTRVKRAVEEVLAREREAGTRPLIVLEFGAQGAETGRGSQFERCLALARYLSSDALRGASAVAYVPNDLAGHAMLPVLACEQVIVSPTAVLGNAGVDENAVDEVMRRGYREIVERRRTVPVAAALGMLDRDLTVQRVETLDGAVFLLDSEVEALRETTTVSSITTIAQPGDLAALTGREWRLHGFASHFARGRQELAAALQIPPDALEQDPLLEGTWQPLWVDVTGNVNATSVNWILRTTQQEIERGRFNLICVAIDSPGGSAADSLRLASFLAEIDPAQMRTVAFVQHAARGDAAIIALACDHLVMSENALLGGPGAESIADRDREAIHAAVREVARQKGRDWSLAAAIVDPELRVFAFSQPGSDIRRYFSEPELAEQPAEENWVRGKTIALAAGLTREAAEELRLVTNQADDVDQLRQVYGWDADLTVVRPNWAHRFIEYLATPQLAAMLLFVACFAGFAELSSPGLGIPGFLAAVCFVIYFWSNFLNGTAGWLEVLLFLLGVTAVALELLVLPGVGIFGFGGGLLIIGSIVLASQTFVIPRNAYQLSQVPGSLATVVAAMAGAVAAIYAMRRYLPETPLVRRLLLAPLGEDQLDELDRRESLADFEYLSGKRGTTQTRLNPSGKARFGDEIIGVVSDGEAIDPNVDIVVTEVHGNRVVVRPLT